MVVPDWLNQRLVGNGSFDKYNRATSQHILEVADVLCSAGPFEVKLKPYVTGEVKSSCDGQQHTLYCSTQCLWQDDSLCELIGRNDFHFSCFYLSAGRAGSLVDSLEQHLAQSLRQLQPTITTSIIVTMIASTITTAGSCNSSSNATTILRL